MGPRSRQTVVAANQQDANVFQVTLETVRPPEKTVDGTPPMATVVDCQAHVPGNFEEATDVQVVSITCR
jgi:hypothetical protein